MNQLNQKQRETVRVVRTDIDSHVYIIEYGENKKLYRLPMLPFQRKMPSPAELQVVVDKSEENEIHLCQDYEKLIREFYREGDEVEFAVQGSFSNYYVLVEDHGFTTRVAKELIPNPAITPRLLCRIENIKGRYISVKPAGKVSTSLYHFSISDDKLSQLIGNEAWNTPELHKLLLGNSSDDLFDTECHQWIVELVEHTTEDVGTLLGNIRTRLLAILETSDMLLLCDLASRNVLEARFSDLVEQLGYQIDAISLIKNQTAQAHIDKVLQSMEHSSFVYHARRQFYIMLGTFQQSPVLLQDNISHIIDIIRKQKGKLAKREPFGKLWIKVLEHFIRQTSRNSNELNKPQVIRIMILALALQLYLAESCQTTLFDVVLNRSLLYRLCTKMGVTEPRKLLEESLYNLVSDSGDQFVYVVDTDDATLTANIIANQVSDMVDSSLAPAVFNTDKIKLMVKEGRISLSAQDVTSYNAYLPLPSRLNLWHNLTIRLSEKPSAELRGNKNLTLPYFKRLWSFIYNSFFEERQNTTKRDRRRLLPGDEVNIIVTKMLGPNLLFECEVIDEGLEGIKGTIDAAKDIVPYFPGKIGAHSFTSNGYPLILPAIAERTEDGDYHFTMLELVSDFMEEYRIDHLNFNSRLKCLLNSSSSGAQRFPAIAENGLSLSVGTEYGVDISTLTKGKIVEVYAPTQGLRPYINATYRGEVDDQTFSVSAAFNQLMTNYADGETYERETEDEEQRALTVTLDKGRATELMHILECYVGQEEDYIKAYNYISVCRIMAHALHSQRESFYEKRLALIELLNDFALNNSFSQESMQLLEEEQDGVLHDSSPLFVEYQQMRVVSWLNNEEHNDDLYHFSCQHDTPVLKQLAALVLSHNTIKKAGLIPQAEEILEKIRSILKLRRNESNKKFYGKENYKTEFKTSIVYPENSMQPNIVKQTHKILSEICAFMNADGGTLYLGVNDQGVETGVEEDLKQPAFKGNTDHYEDYINNQVAIQMSQEAAHNIHTHWDEDTKSNVLIIDIQPTPNPIAIGGEYYERMGKSARRVNEEYLPIFQANRRKWATEHRIETAEELRSAETQKPADAKAEPDESNETTEVTRNAEEARQREDLIQTSRTRNNIIHDYEADYIPAVGYICFIGSDEYKVLDHDDYQTEDYRLELAIHEEERNGWLVMVYADGSVVKSSINELLGRESERTFKRWDENEVVYAGIALDSDLLVLGFKDGKGNKRLRFETMDNLPSGNMQSHGASTHDVPNDGLHYVEIVHRQEMPSWIQCNAKRTELGIVLKTYNGKELVELLPGCEA